MLGLSAIMQRGVASRQDGRGIHVGEIVGVGTDTSVKVATIGSKY